MSVTKNPAIGSLDPDSLCHSLYAELYNQFFRAQDRKDALHPWGVEEGDDTSIRLHNTAYGFAYAISGAVGGTGSGEGGVLIDYLKKSGGDMSGGLRANYGFEAGAGNSVALEVFARDRSSVVRVHGMLDIYGEGISFGDRVVISYNYDIGLLNVFSDTIDFGVSSIRSSNEMIFGDRSSGVLIASDDVCVAGNSVFHKGNANLSSVDWTMRDGVIAGALFVAGAAFLSGKLTALRGAELGCDGQTHPLCLRLKAVDKNLD